MKSMKMTLIKPLYDNHRNPVDENKIQDLPNGVKDFLKELPPLTVDELKKMGVIVVGGRKKSDKKERFVKAKTKDKDRDFYLTTGNLIGVVNFRDSEKLKDELLRIEVRCRFSEKDTQQYFFNHMLSRVFDCNFAETVDSSELTLQILLAIRLKFLLADAEAIGAFRQYRTFENNDLRFRGKLDINRHIRLNGMTKDKIAYTVRERTTDNPLNHMILYAEKYIKDKGWSVFDGSDAADKDARELLKKIHVSTPTFGNRSLSSVLSDKENLQKIRQPYYAEYYEEIRRVAMALLNDEGANVFDKENEDEINGIVIDGAWLWEEYLAKMAEPLGYWHAIRGKQSKHKIYRFLDNADRPFSPLYPDFRFSNGGDEQKASVVLDAKYKFEKINRDDMAQIFSYMLLTGAKKVGFIYPPQENASADNPKSTQGSNDSEEDEDIGIQNEDTIGTGIRINQHMTNGEYLFKSYRFNKIPEEGFTDSESFKEWISAEEEKLEAVLKDYYEMEETSFLSQKE